MIRYDNSDVSLVTMRTGNYADTINVLRNAKEMVLSSSGGLDAVNVGNAANGVQSITGNLTIQNPPSHTTLSVNDSANTTGRAMTLDTITLTDGLYGRILWLAPAVIEYKVADVASPHHDQHRKWGGQSHGQHDAGWAHGGDQRRRRGRHGYRLRDREQQLAVRQRRQRHGRAGHQAHRADRPGLHPTQQREQPGEPGPFARTPTSSSPIPSGSGR